MKVEPFSGYIFWGLLALFIAGHLVLVRLGGGSRARNIWMILTSLLIVGLVQGDQAAGVILFILSLSAAVFLAGKAVLGGTLRGRRIRLNLAFIALACAVLGYFKYAYVQQGINLVLGTFLPFLGEALRDPRKHIYLLGVSYFSFKFIHFLADCYTRKIKNPDLLTFWNYILFFPSFFSGPINRYEAFAESIRAWSPEERKTDYQEGIKRIIHGLFRKVVVAQNILPYAITSLDLSDPAVTPWRAVVGIYAYMLYVYFDFSGYTEMAIGSGRLVGVRLPENFNYPFFKRNLQEFWANWHMSLTAWLTDYIYWPLARRFRHLQKLRKKPVTISIVAIIITFAICGVWHGDGVNFLLWGTYHGVGLALLNLYTQFEKKYYPRPWKETLSRSRVAYGVSNFITFQFVAFGFLLFALDMGRIRLFFRLFG